MLNLSQVFFGFQMKSGFHIDNIKFRFKKYFSSNILLNPNQHKKDPSCS